MSTQMKRVGMKGMRIFAGVMFVFLMLFNIQITLDDGNANDISLFGLKFSLVEASAISPGQQCQANCGFQDCCRVCYVGQGWVYAYDYTSGGCGSCPNFCQL